MHLKDDVAAADEFALDIDLRDGGPIRKLFDSLANFGVFQDVDVFEFGPGSLENFDGSVGKTALRKAFRALHEEHHAVLIDNFLDFLLYVTHGPPSTRPNVA